jgi:hypothetical protein
MPSESRRIAKYRIFRNLPLTHFSLKKISQKMALLPSSCESVKSSTLLDFPGPGSLPAQKTNKNFPQTPY